MVLGIAAVGYYILMRGKEVPEETSLPGPGMTTAPLSSGGGYEWSFSSTDQGTAVKVKVGEKTYDAGTYAGTCREVKLGTLGILGEKSDNHEMSRVQCWFAGSGDEIGIFQEGGKLLIKAGELGEGDPETGPFRGNFKTIIEI